MFARTYFRASNALPLSRDMACDTHSLGLELEGLTLSLYMNHVKAMSLLCFFSSFPRDGSTMFLFPVSCFCYEILLLQPTFTGQHRRFITVAMVFLFMGELLQLESLTLIAQPVISV